MKKAILYIFLSLFCLGSTAQISTFIKGYNNYDAVSINNVQGKNYIYYTLAPVNKSYVAELTDNGDTLHTKVFNILNKCNTPFYRNGYWPNDILVYTSTFSGTNYGILYTKSDTNLAYSIFKRYTVSGNTFAVAPTELRDSSMLFSGSTGIPNYMNMALMKTDKSGNVLWAKSYDNAGNNDGLSTDIIVNSDKSMFFSAGTGNNSGLDNDYILTKIDSAGNILWANKYGSTDDDGGGRLRKINNNFYVVGNTNGFGADNVGIYLLKIDTLGNLISAKTIYNNLGNPTFYNEYSNGIFTLSGIANYSVGSSWDSYVMQIDTNGIVLNNKVYSLSSGSYPSNFVKTSKGEYIINTSVNGMIPVPKLLKVDSAFNSSCLPSYSLNFITTDVTSLTTVTPITFTVSNITVNVGADTILPASNTYSVNTECVGYVGINEQQGQENLLSVYPNPANNIININYKLPEGISQAVLNMYDYTGKLISKQFVYGNSGNLSATIENLPDGIYMYTIMANNSLISSQKIIIAK